MKIVKFQKFIRRSDLRNNPNWVYLFGDNLEQSGMGGQAREMRGEPNAVGIPTKKRPSNAADAFFNDEEFFENKLAIDTAFSDAKIENAEVIVVPADGLGTGRAQLQHRAPRTFQYLNFRIQRLKLGD